jgi:micrococcal nuclease
MTRLAAALLLALLVTPAAAEPWPVCDRGQPSAACVIDADSIWFKGRKIRLAATDAPETEQASCQAEYAAGIRARDRLADLLGTGATIHPTGARDRYGRHLATVTAGDVEDILISEGLSLPYVAGERDERTKHWCGG